MDGFFLGPHAARLDARSARGPLTLCPATAPAEKGREPLFEIRPEAAGDRAEVEALFHEAFGPGRFAKTAERLRENNRPIADLSLLARRHGRLAAACRVWPIQIGHAPALFLGPIAIASDLRGQGLGLKVVETTLERAQAAAGPWRAMVLIGTLGFFRHAGFECAAPGALRFPGPVDPRRVLWRPLAPGGLVGLAGALSALPGATIGRA